MYKRPADFEVIHGAQQKGPPNPVKLAPETPKRADSTGINKPIPETRNTQAPGQYGRS